jgi:uncharacterized Zn finger protein (UPF0148 family)
VGVLQDLSEVVKGLKHGKITAKYCPRCESPRLKVEGGLNFWLTSGTYVCLDCGYRGPIAMEKEETPRKEKNSK